MISSMKRSAASVASDALKCAMQTRSTPHSASASSLSRSVQMRAGTGMGARGALSGAAGADAASVAKYSRGCGSKVSTQVGRPSSSARCRNCASTARWPLCTPSKLPIVSAQGSRRSAGGRRRKTSIWGGGAARGRAGGNSSSDDAKP